MHPFVQAKKNEFQAALDHLQTELASLRTGRASPQLVENVRVEAYGSNMDLKSMASINVQDAKTIIIDPWDKSLLQAVEKAIRDADIGVNPAVDGQIIRIALPQMTEETRKKLVKIMKEKCEEARIALRGVREGARDEVKKQEIGEDEKFKMLDELDKTTKEFTELVESIGEQKEEEIMTV
ncbi:ribosome recycling factor [Candidatus Uhrbacteria bacterium RIFOXYB12_FULL_58_10]|uniref:Ribosome-recycling factor n=1 Tax=Candidatus Uhrbacteria bacterium RIFOXYB2_FULL_57_15 TaxID=1802422 RepID=A0A1F7W4Q6_9BACT|nr:MAG: ribosome recycling factor [Candidatus Uhrbacteria bacterium RIFOXYB12_FULL_58_10]OGL97739.1 MAG: ribosome recycling factor [Candidatus Uhrbacteria bacterium RIFOXYB2_FULL_57_15]OGM00558.1 MAG: ribosome recycling factor [Candidatus Uhrbacteria bacterium RIFOXYC12_FULL_57_11]